MIIVLSDVFIYIYYVWSIAVFWLLFFRSSHKSIKVGAQYIFIHPLLPQSTFSVVTKMYSKPDGKKHPKFNCGRTPREKSFLSEKRTWEVSGLVCDSELWLVIVVELLSSGALCLVCQVVCLIIYDRTTKLSPWFVSLVSASLQSSWPPLAVFYFMALVWCYRHSGFGIF